ncbi:MAG: hypothetical protein JXR37_15345 [Kiritimatiellae bacterium]|nr:hypothetical protein [Kiritimatiellia bacterium]
MGFFSDRCQALIDKETGRALSGDALFEAMKDRKWPRCGYRVKKAARGCSKCGALAPGGWSKCPKCGKWVGNESHFCWNCRAALRPEDQTAILDGVWQKPVGALAKRLDVGDVKELLHRKHKIFVGEGSIAILLKGGRFKDSLNPGTHTLDSLGTRINNWGDPPPESVVLVDSGDLVLPVRVDDILSSEDIPVELYTEVHIRVAPNDDAAHAFMANVMKDARELSYDDFVARLKSEIRYAVSNITNTSTVEDLFKDPERRLHIEDELQQVVKRSEEEYGFELVRVSSAEFTGRAYEELRARNGEIELKRRHIEFDQRLRNMLQKEQMDQFKSERDMEEWLAQMAMEKDVAAEHRDHEMALMRQALRHEISDKEVLHQMDTELRALNHDLAKTEIVWGKETKELMHTLALEAKARQQGREQAVADADAEVTIRGRRHGEEFKEATDWADLAAKEDHREQDIEDRKADREMRVLAKKAELFDGVKTEALLALVEDETTQKAMIELNRQKVQAGQSADVILAMAAEKSPAVAQALLNKTGMEKEQLEKFLADYKTLFKDMREHDERIFNKAMETTTEAAKHPPSNTTTSTNIVK